MTDHLPIHDAIPALLSALSDQGRAVLMAPPGAGKTTVVPLEMLKADAFDGRLIMLEPRRLAARGAAERMAQTLGERAGDIVGYRIRGEAKVSKSTRIEVVTEGILTRMLQSDPALEGVGAVIFDEFHERSLNADLGLALAWEAMGALRDDLKLVVMSATLDADPVALLLDDAPIVRSEGRAFPVETRHLERPLAKGARLPEATADLVLDALRGTDGGVLVFLPGEGEIRRCESALKGRLPSDCHLHTLFGAMNFAAQRAAILPAKNGRKIVLATSIAETSLTIQDIRVVVDAGRARRARFDAGSGMSRLVTERVSKAEAEQRRGRAGRVAPGICYRLWTKGEEGGMPPFAPAEIETADLAPLALELASWGSPDGAGLAFLTPANAGVLAEAQALLRGLGALDRTGRITDHGAKLSRLPLHPRLGHMLLTAGPNAAELAALWGDRDPLPRGASMDLALRLEAIRDPKGFTSIRGIQANRGGIERIRTEAKRLRRMAGDARPDLSHAQMAALAYPDRVALRRPGDAPRFVMSGGKGAVMDEGDALAGARLLVITDTDGNPREARIRQATQIGEGEVRDIFADQIRWIDSCAWSKRDGRVVARRQECLGAVVLDDRNWKEAPSDIVAKAMLDGVRELGLRPSDAAKRFIARVELVRAEGNSLPAMTESALMDTLDTWLLPHLSGVKTSADWKKFDILDALRAMLDWNQMSRLDVEAPAHFVTPLGNKTPIDYSGETPEISLRLQEMFGVTRHPTVGKTPLRVTLLSPARRPVQTTTDIPNFWATSYADVRKDMRGCYPKHPWPEDPTVADPTLRAKPRGK
ncbi:ATP-dependent helicase HrpB [Aliiroseovarius halocynthiae]|uniref:ATP-dependent helicase HrpB n=1 Tax=Aliiroseovarius halocynthiae TaxID=985055 RepID=A0A545SZT4_9RHOB|nr:ATP-dependent helicase HrpB [Aliiroseovarius halocynthiae]TQV70486.1 ATP-dependent helicase HrpB [Aliiroseovarius halocynthiae]SMR81792.1 ATP-dependent helicase HrpB [Aliiroseovarius halocynthiae]